MWWGMLSVLIEIQEDRHVELKDQDWLAENAAAVLDAVVDAIVTINARGIILSLNTATQQLFGYAAHELVGQPVEMLMPEPYKSEHQGYVARYLEHGHPGIIGVGRELTAQRRDGSIFPIYLAVSEIPGAEYFVGIIRDLSAQKAAEQALAEQKERVAQVGRLASMGEMTASIAHEINQPLTAIAMYAQACLRLLAKPDHDAEKLMSALEKLNAQSIRAGDVIERIQRFVQNSSGDLARSDLVPMLRDLRNLAAGDARLHGIDLKLELSADLPQVYCDPIKIQQVALNLVRNAVDAMFEIECRHGNRITVQAAHEQGGVMVSVIDSGPGVAKDYEDKMFTPFHTTKRDGMGMGLAICRSIVEENGGHLNYRNNSDHGATFFFWLPVGDQGE
ncbi:MAG: PAS domain S-box protein [Pseudomonadales bacterium]